MLESTDVVMLQGKAWSWFRAFHLMQLRDLDGPFGFGIQKILPSRRECLSVLMAQEICARMDRELQEQGNEPNAPFQKQ